VVRAGEEWEGRLKRSVIGFIRQMLTVGMVLVVMASATGCISQDGEEEKLRDLDFTVVSGDEIPEELLTQIDEQKEKPFHLTYIDQGYLYLAVGYGKQDTSGYSIRITECSESETKITFGTELVGPDAEEETVEADTWPWVTIKLEETDKNVEFNS
jgi:hypothetical protein